MIDLIWFLVGMAFVEAILKPTVVYFTQRETRRIKAIADLLMPELMARTDPFMPGWIKEGRKSVVDGVWGTIHTMSQDKGMELDVFDVLAVAEQFTKLYSPFENGRRFPRDQE